MRLTRAAHFRITRLVAGALLAALALVGGAALPAVADGGTYAISGTVTHPDTSTFGDNEVHVSAYLGAGSDPAGEAWTDAAGHYSIPDLVAGTYVVFFDAVDPTLQDCWFGTKPPYLRNSSTTVTITSGDQVANQIVYAHGAIKGRVALGNSSTFATTGQAQVEYAPAISVPGHKNPDFDKVTSIGIDADGRYLIPDLEAGTWMLRIIPSIGLGVGSTEWTEAGVGSTGITNDRGTTVLSAGGSVSGHIDVAGQPAGAGEVQVLLENQYGDWLPIAETDDNGDYVTIPLISGHYPLRLDYTGTRSIADEWFDYSNHAYVAFEATTVKFSPAGGTGFNANLQVGANIKGIALDAAGNPVAGARLEAQSYFVDYGGGMWGWLFSTQSGPDGRFDLSGLPPSTEFDYKITFKNTDDRFPVPRNVEKSISIGQQVTLNVRYYLLSQLTVTLDCGPCTTYPYPPYVGRLEKLNSSGTWVEYSTVVSTSINLYKFGNAVPGKYRIRFTASGFPTYSVAPFSLAEGQTIDFGLVGLSFTKVGSLTVSGTAKVGSTLKAALGTFSPTPSAITYSWLRDGVAIAGATANTYVPTGDDLGHALKVQATVTRSGYTTRVISSSSTAKVALGTLTGTTPKITGTARVGSVLTLVPGTWSPSADLAFQWKVNGAAVLDATSGSFTVRPGDVGKKVTVTVAATQEFYTPLSKTSTSTSSVAFAAFVSAPVPTIVGTPQVGVELTAVPGAWDPTATYGYRWYANGEAITGATHEKFTPTGSQRNKKITVKVTATLLGYTTTSRTSLPTALVAWGVWDATPDVSIIGDTRVGSRLTANTAGWQTNARFTYQWYANGSKITDATKSTFTPTSSQLGKTIKVKVTTSTSGYPVWTQTTGETAELAHGQFTTTPTPVISGTAKVGSTLNVTPGTWVPTATLKYQWFADGVPIPNATATTYKLPAARDGAMITVSVTATRSAYEPGMLESAGVGPVLP